MCVPSSAWQHGEIEDMIARMMHIVTAMYKTPLVLDFGCAMSGELSSSFC